MCDCACDCGRAYLQLDESICDGTKMTADTYCDGTRCEVFLVIGKCIWLDKYVLEES